MRAGVMPDAQLTTMSLMNHMSIMKLNQNHSWNEVQFARGVRTPVNLSWHIDSTMSVSKAISSGTEMPQ